MINFIKGDLFKSDCEAWVNTVNCVGISGKGIALEFKRRFPDNYKIYRDACNKGEVKTGKMFIVEVIGGRLTNEPKPRYIINFPTKQHWKNDSKLEYIERGLGDLCNVIFKGMFYGPKIKSVAIPALGAGCGNLKWAIVKDKIRQVLTESPDLYDVRFDIYESR